MSEPKFDHATRIALLEQSINGVKLELSQINANIGKLVWAIILAIVMAFVQFALKGGLHG
tara:strand:+ start:157 stop:336 length:180 start_codon:yes stop_codon:yes gene_type:complete